MIGNLRGHNLKLYHNHVHSNGQPEETVSATSSSTFNRKLDGTMVIRSYI